MINLATKHNDPMRKLSILERSGYGMGDFACNMIYQPMAAFLLLYYTNVVGVGAGVAASVLAISKIFDGVSDLIMGHIVDKTHSRYGKARPWLLRMCIPMAICFTLMFSVPDALGGMARIAWMFITYNLVNTVCYTALNCPYSAMTCQITVNQKERGTLGIYRMLFAGAGQLFINTAVLKLVGVLGDGSTYDQAGWTRATIILGIISIVAFLFCFIATKERVVETEEEKTKEGVITSLKSLFHNKYWLMLTASTTIIYIMTALFFGSAAYYAQYVLGNVDYYAPIANTYSIAQIVGLLTITPILMAKLGKQKTFQISIALTIVGCIGTYFMTTVTGVCVMNALKGLGLGAGSSMIYGMIADTVDYGEWKTGVRTAGMGNAANSFGMKVGSAFGTSLLGWIIQFNGFDAALKMQPDSAVTAIGFCYIWLPVAILAVEFIIMTFYRLDKEYPVIASDLEKRRAE